MTVKFKDLPTFKPQFGTLLANETIEVFEWLNFQSLKNFDEIIPSDFIQRIKKLSTPQRGINISRLVTIIFIFHNTEDFFNRGWRNRFYEFDSYDYLVFKELEIDMTNFPEKIDFDCRGM